MSGGGWGETPHMIVKCFGCTTVHNKALHASFIHSIIQLNVDDVNGDKMIDGSLNHDRMQVTKQQSVR